MSVQVSVTASAQGIGGGEKIGKAVLMVTDNLGNPVPGAEVTGAFEGTFTEGFTGMTDASGSVTFETTLSARRRVSVRFCVTDVVVASLDWSQASPVCSK